MKNVLLAWLIAIGFSTTAQVNRLGDLQFFIGTGPDTLGIVLDFHEPYSTTSFAFGILATDSITWNQAVSLIGAADPSVQFGFGLPSIIRYYGMNRANSGSRKWVLLRRQGINWDRQRSMQSYIRSGEWGAFAFLDTTTTLTPEVQEVALPPTSKGIGEIQFYAGSGSDTATLVVDFLHDFPYDSYRYGILFSDSISIQDMLISISQDTGISVDMSGGFLNSIIIQKDTGAPGQPNYWSTWSGSSLSGLLMNSGIGTYISPGEVAGCTYTDFFPARRPRLPLSGIPSYPIHHSALTSWIGTGTDSTILVVDFKDGQPPIAFGYIFTAPSTIQDMLNELDQWRSDLSISMPGGFLTDITFGSRSGVGGAPDYWGTWSASNGADWKMNLGLSTALEKDGWIGLSYTNFEPAVYPYVPVSAGPNLGTVEQNGQKAIFLGPNPTTGEVNLHVENSLQYRVIDIQGKIMLEGELKKGQNSIDIGSFRPGVYSLEISSGTWFTVKKVILK
ncbi:MAG: T9SS type A sorting domain-containing protein [Bacteroidota bacterium]|nr:T9SS type A sorting domain-containing protein [Bacteroidota bacterium]MDX5506517.1 T9SS type A sorting domain-containing protein [Bacteroidota bacterium]